MDILPPNKPHITREDALKKLFPYTDKVNTYKVILLGIRGYFKDTMGKPGVNDRGIYDDALCMITPDNFYTFNFNTDPSRAIPGVATLVPGLYFYKIGMHGVSGDHPYEALRQWSRVTVTRDGQDGEFTDTSGAPFYTDIHRGGFGTTSSLGCQTVPPAQWEEFHPLVKELLAKYGQEVVPYVLSVA